MASIKPFKALRPQPQLAKQVASRPYDVLNSAEAIQVHFFISPKVRSICPMESISILKLYMNRQSQIWMLL
jgi:hypothetical protein